MAAGNLTQVAEWIASLTVFTGGRNVMICDLSNIPELVEPQDCPVLSPYPDAFCTEVEFTRLTFRDSVYGRQYRLDYTLTYTLFYAVVAEGLTLFNSYAGMADAWSAVITELVKHSNETPNGAYDIRPIRNPTFGPVIDPSGQVFHGCRFDLRVVEYH